MKDFLFHAAPFLLNLILIRTLAFKKTKTKNTQNYMASKPILGHFSEVATSCVLCCAQLGCEIFRSAPLSAFCWFFQLPGVVAYESILLL